MVRTARRYAGIPASVAVLPSGPERAVSSNAVLDRDFDRVRRAEALDPLAETYRATSVADFAAWVHDSDHAMGRDPQRRGYTRREATRAMGMPVDEVRMPRPLLDIAPPGWSWADYRRLINVPPGFLAHADTAAYHILIARHDGEDVATTMAVDHDGDRGIYNVATLDRVRRRGLGTGLTALLVHDAIDRGHHTASLQSAPMLLDHGTHVTVIRGRINGQRRSATTAVAHLV